VEALEEAIAVLRGLWGGPGQRQRRPVRDQRADAAAERLDLGRQRIACCRVVTQHHSIEDTSVSPHLREHDAQLGGVLDRLRAEHVVVHDLLEEVDRALVGYVEESEDSSGLDDALARLSTALLDRPDGEARDLLGPLARFGFGDG
jgi:hypothetical protein